MLNKLPMRPGIYKDEPPLAVETFYQDGNNVRSYRGKVEKIGGWVKYLQDPLQGKARSITGWTSNTGGTYMAVGTHSKLYGITDGTAYDITPFRDTGTLGTDPFSVTSGSPIVTVTDASHGLTIGDTVHYSGATEGGGITISGEYTVINVVDASTYQIIHGSNASSTDTTTGGNAVAYSYELAVGQEYGALFFGWGVGAWGAGTWGTPRTSNVLYAPRTWSLAQWGENLIGSPRGGTLYEWDLSLNGHALPVSNAPPKINFMFVSPERIVVALGTNQFIGNDYNPMLVRWSDQEDNTDWTPSALNTSGEFKLGVGSLIVAGTPSRLQNLIWTDTALYSMQYLRDTEFIFGFDLLGTNCGLAGPGAFAEKDGVAYWMTPNGQFYFYDGQAPRALDCPCQRYVFDNIIRRQFDIVHCGINSKYSEVWWWYASGSSGNEVDRFIMYNYADNAWYIGDIDRTAWLDRNYFDGPIAIGPDGYVYMHEIGNSADGSDMNDFIETAPFDMDDGDTVVNLSRIVPDMELQGEVEFTIRTRRFPNKPMEMEKVRNYTDLMHKVDLRAQGRQMSLKIASGTLDTFWRMGDLRVDVTPAGPR